MPVSSEVQPFPTGNLRTGSSVKIKSDGSVTMTVTPSIGFQIKLDAFGKKLVDTKIATSLTTALILRAGANTPSCPGAHYGLDYHYGVDIDLQNPLPGWTSKNGPQHFSIYDFTGTIQGVECRPWSGNPTVRSISSGLEGMNGEDITPSAMLHSRADNPDALFPDIFGDSIFCPNNINTPTGNCKVSVDDGEEGNDDINAKRDTDLLEDIILELRELQNSSSVIDSRHSPKQLVKRKGKGPLTWCTGEGKITIPTHRYPTSGQLIDGSAKFESYGLANPDDCNNYGNIIVVTALETND
jgi:hypothetical protein